jgi:hypothetical protein
VGKMREIDGGQEDFWRMAIETWQSSGLSIRQFCKDEGLSEPQFYQWRKKLVCCGTEVAIQDDPGQPAFIEVAIPKNNDIAMELLLASGNMLRIHPGTDIAILKDMLLALREVGLC